MKKISTFIGAVLLLTGTVFAQTNFQGTMNYEMNFMGEGIEAYQAMLPTGMELKVLKTDVLMEVQGGMAAMAMGRTLTKTKTGETFMIKDSEEVVYVMDPKANKDEEPKEESQVTKEDEVITIAGYECQKYKVVSQTPQGESTAYVWVTDKFSIPKSSQSSGGGMSGMLDIKGVTGTPLKVMTTQMGMTVTITAKEINTTLPNKKEFKLPKGYAKEPFDMEKMMGGGM